MKQVTVDRVELMHVMADNREAHAHNYRQALEDRKETMRETLTDWLALMEADPEKAYSYTNELVFPIPPNYLEEYDRVLAMLEMSSEETITLDSTEFDCYVRDKWQWKNAFLRATTAYSDAGKLGGV